MTTRSASEVIDFWFVQHGREQWFGGGPEFDAKLAAAFAQTHEEVSRGEAWEWRREPEGRVAEIVVLDQFSRQLYRGHARAFAQDPMALTLAQEAVYGGHAAALSQPQRMFVLMPFMHSESLLIHDEAVRLFTELGNQDVLNFELAHQALLRRFGRYPRRNEALGRQSSAEELEYIESDEGRW
jgi:uncharacterized protein (DUF924 family)